MSALDYHLYASMAALPVTTFRKQQLEIMDRLQERPILLTREGVDSGVLIHPNLWNALLAELARYRRADLLREQIQVVEQGEYITFDQFEQGLRDRGLLNEQ